MMSYDVHVYFLCAILSDMGNDWDGEFGVEGL